MITLNEIGALRAWRSRWSGSVGFVPTMGYLHEGHLSLVRSAAARDEAVVASIFVNPSQFNDPSDLAAYPRDLDRDLALLSAAGCDLVFAPGAEAMYPEGFQTWVLPGPVAEPNEGAFRPGHFRGVATVVLKLLNLVQPDRAYFGQKDAQQVAVVRRMARDLNLPAEIVPCPTVREADGLAMSSRNTYLSPEERAAAPVLFRALLAGRAAWLAGEREASAIRAAVCAVLDTEPRAETEYVSVADPLSMAELETLPEAGEALLSLTVKVGPARLLDNLLLGQDAQSGIPAGG